MDAQGLAKAIVVGHSMGGKAAMHAVVAQQMGVRLDAAEVVDGDDLDIRPPALDDGAQHQAPDAAKPVDENLDGHGVFSDS